MGTSRNDRSPLTPSWKVALAVLGTVDTGVSQQNMEIWRAVAADRGEKLLRDFSNPSLIDACRWISEGVSPHDAIQRFNAATMHESNAGLAVDMGRRALIRCAAQKGDTAAFVGELFAEAVSYYASRDLPSYVAAKGRVGNTSEAIKLKDSLREVTKNQVGSVGPPKLDPKGWRAYISDVLKTLQSRGSSE